jgi:catechol 2,3-dioxygenase-like lactoylglutathione lyase family enzyme
MQPKFIEHISLIVKDIQQTEEFYSKFLAKPIIHNESMVAYKVGDTRLFFKVSPKGTLSGTYDKDDIGMNHIGWGVHTVDELKEFQKFLSEAGIKTSEIELGKFSNEYIWFDDPNGIRLEIYRN